MDLNRCKEIVSSPKEIQVHYQGVPVWIENIDENSKMATVHERGAHDQKRLISIESLEE